MTARVARRADVPSTVVDGCVVLIDARHGAYVGLDDVGTYIWNALEEPVTVDALIAQLSSAFRGERTEVEADTAHFLDEMAAKSLIEVAI